VAAATDSGVGELLHSIRKELDKRRPKQVRIGSFGCKFCGGQTSHQKPYCTKHIDRMEYAQELAEIEYVRRSELRLAAKGRVVRPHTGPDSWIGDIHILLGNSKNGLTSKQVASYLKISKRASKTFLDHMFNAGRVMAYRRNNTTHYLNL
jgi:hypothetical protein